jgi:uncharacterized protein
MMRTETQVAGMPCPLCKIPLALSDREGIEIDYCPQCRGVWLDRGELDKIIARSVDDVPAPTPQAAPTPQYQAPQYQQPQYQSGYQQPYPSKYGHKRQKHWLEKMFD